MGTIELIKEIGSTERIPDTHAGDKIKLALANAGVLTRVERQINLGLPFIVTFQQIDELADKIAIGLTQYLKKESFE